MWVYVHSEHSSTHDLFTVGHYDPTGKWHTDSDWSTKKEAGDRCNFLNGGKEITKCDTTRIWQEDDY